MQAKKKAVEAVSVSPDEFIREHYTLTREQARVVHRALFDTGWWLRWGQKDVDDITRGLNAFFAGDDDHLKRR